MKPSTYNELEAKGDHTTILRPLYADEAMTQLAMRSHGHVFNRRDGALARCGGPALCQWCQLEQQILEALKGYE